ncbi:hypothetical protein GCM10010211_35650 [Streptomyces albospinus]|uniref:Uncharacterized protein n=1 Tax=Streptomyces albospinus TaxID=285515 RepID=A0ABQ2V6I2_9ACTN|nr:hypothetical protein GCM10010211_35650 [Streptomyces albospinus]
MAVATGIAMSGVFTVVAAQAASAADSDGPIPYADCMKDMKTQHGTKNSPAIVCDAMAKQGWIQDPKG